MLSLFVSSCFSINFNGQLYPMVLVSARYSPVSLHWFLEYVSRHGQNLHCTCPSGKKIFACASVYHKQLLCVIWITILSLQPIFTIFLCGSFWSSVKCLFAIGCPSTIIRRIITIIVNPVNRKIYRISVLK